MSMRGFDLSGYHETVAGRIVNLLLVIFGSGVCGAFISSPRPPIFISMARQYDSESRLLLMLMLWPASCSVRWNSLLTQTFAPTLVVIAIYVDSLLFMLGSSLTQFTLDANDNVRVCRATILLCITAYLSSKLLIYLFLVDRAVSVHMASVSPSPLMMASHLRFVLEQHIVRGTAKSRFKSKLYLFHLGFILNGLCVIAVNHDILICICVVDVIINVYLTTLFLRPIVQSHSFHLGWLRSVNSSKHGPLDSKLRCLTKKTFLGTCCTLLSSLSNLIGQMVFDGQPYWLCLLCCGADVLFSAIVIQCITSNEHPAMSGAPAGSGSGGSWDSSTYYHPSTSRRTGSSTLCERGGCAGGGSGGGAPGDGSGQGSQDMVLGPIQTVPAPTPTLAKDEGERNVYSNLD
ncbi:hypothetical protein PG997_010794 [Apiospora hydei]|uniref:Uncharacterized protein n=1 Tax=Apiospora hydei TaxID=1337664 RepID=A0ABR1VH85_9PEZI